MKNFEEKFYPNIENSKKLEKKESTFEVMKTPEIVIQEEKGIQLFSLLLKAENPEWGETETSLAKEFTSYFQNNPLSPEILQVLKDFRKQDIDEETLYYLALTYQHPERIEKIFEIMAKHKPHVVMPLEVHQEVMVLLGHIDQTFSDLPLVEKISLEIEQDGDERSKRLEETKKRIEGLIDFFKPDSKSTQVQKLIFVPTNPLHRVNSGRNFSGFQGEQIIISHIDNIDNQDHEFLHGIINPIVEKISQKLTNEQKEKISELANNKLKQDYGEGYFSLLCEEFIRTYNDVLKKGEQPQTYKDFKEKIARINEDQFQNSLTQSESLKTRCMELGIATIEDFKDKSQEYFDKFEKNQLRDLIFEIYQAYINRPNVEVENFEKFVLSNFLTNI